MTLNEKIGKILTQHEEGEDFFNTLDYMIKGDRDILEDFLHFFMNDAGKRLNLNDTGLVVSGGFGNAIMTMYGDRLTENFREVIVTNGGIRLGNEALIFKDKLLCKNWIFIDDSYYLGRTRAGISVALKKIRPDASIYETYVIYDGSMGRADKVKSMYRYNK